MPTNDFLPFGSAAGANVMAQADYLALPARANGFAAGTANSAQLNKAWRQSSLMASALAQFIADQSGQSVTDDGTTATIEANLIAAIKAAGGNLFAIDSGIANAYVGTYTPALVARAEGQVLRFKVKTANTGASTFNDGLGAAALIGAAHAALQGGELVANGDAWVQWNSSIGAGSYILLFCTGAAEQVATATQSQHAVALGQIAGLLTGKASVATTLAGYGITDAVQSSTYTAGVAAINATVATKQALLGYTPVQAGTGVSQLSNLVKIGYDGSGPRITIDTTDFGRFITEQNYISYASAANAALGFESVGAYVMATYQPGTSVGPGVLVAGSNLRPSATGGNTTTAVAALVGTWMCQGYCAGGSNVQSTTIFLRVS